MKMSAKHIGYFVVAVVAAVGVIAGVYYGLNLEAVGPIDLALEYRGVETPAKLWLNGYFGHFFQFEQFGNTIWLAIPILFWIMLNAKKRTRVEWAFLLFYLVGIVIVTVHGYQTYRYKFTLFPLVIPFILYYLHQIFAREEYKVLRSCTLLVIAALALFNAWYFGVLWFFFYQVWFLALPLALYFAWIFARSKKHRKIGIVIAVVLVGGFSAYTFKALQQGPSQLVDKIRNHTFLNRTIPTQLFQTIEELDLGNGAILTNNSPNIYYYTNAKAIYYKGVLDWSYQINDSITGGRTPHAVAVYVRDSLNCDYVLSSPFQDHFNATFRTFIAEECDTIIFDEPGYVLVKIRP
jgi:hypothetical protein